MGQISGLLLASRCCISKNHVDAVANGKVALESPPINRSISLGPFRQNISNSHLYWQISNEPSSPNHSLSQHQTTNSRRSLNPTRAHTHTHIHTTLSPQTTTTMPRQRTTARARPTVPARAPAAPTQQQTRPATTLAAPPSAATAAPTAPTQAPTQASQGPGLIGQMASTAA